MEQVKAVAHAVLAEEIERVDHLGDEQAELAPHAAGLFPPPGTLGRQLHPHADARLDVVQLGVLHDQFKLAELLDHRDDVPADFRRQDDGFDELVVLEAVADDWGVIVVNDRHHGQQFRLAAGFQAEAVRLAEGVDFFDDVAAAG